MLLVSVGRHAADAGLDESRLRLKVLEAGMALLLDRAFQDEDVLFVAVRNVRGELTNTVQGELGLEMELGWIDASTLQNKLKKPSSSGGQSKPMGHGRFITCLYLT
jgi:hypothetical protein